MKKILLAFAGLLSMQSAVLAQDYNPEVTVDGLIYAIKGEEASLIYGGTASGDIVIKSEVPYEGKMYPVTSVADYAFKTWGNTLPVTSVEFPASLRRIGKESFSNTAIRELEIPETVDSIGSGAFSFCPELKRVTLNGGKGYMEGFEFTYCNSLESVDISEGHTVVTTGMFCGCSLLSAVSLPSSLKEISGELYTQGAFQYCEALKSIALPEGLISIGYSAFFCSGLESITLPANLTSLSSGVFNSCPQLHDARIPSAIKILPASTFYSCSALESVEISDNVEVIEPYCFEHCLSLKEVKLSENLKEIGEYAFRDCIALPEMRLPNSLVALGNNAFSGCNSLKEIYIGKNLETIGYNCFGNNSSLERISVDPDNQYFSSVDGILADKQCTELIVAPKNISGTYTLPASIRKLRAFVFAKCANLTGLILNPGLEVIEDGVISDCSLLKELEIPASVNEIATGAFSGNCLDSFKVDEGNQNYSSTLGMLLDKPGALVISDVVAQDNIILPASVVEIGDYAFSSSAIREVTCNEGLKKIGNSSFSYSSIEKIEFPSTLTSIGEYAFTACNSLKYMSLPESVSEIGNHFLSRSGIEELIFNGGVKDVPEEICIGCENLKKVDLKGVETIGMQAFSNHAMVSVDIPATVSLIETGAFSTGNLDFNLVRCYAKTPPETGGFPFGWNTYAMELQVPAASVELYSNADEWKNFHITYIPDGVSSKVLKVECNNYDFAVLVGLTKDNLMAGEDYVLRFKIKGIGINQDMTISTTNNIDEQTEYFQIPVTSDWGEHCVEFTPANSEGTGIAWYLSELSGALLLDDVVLTKKGDSQNIMENGDIEGYDRWSYQIPGWWCSIEDAMSVIVDTTASSVEQIMHHAANASGRWTVYSIDGHKLLDTTDESKVKSLPAGLYIINGKKILVR